MRILFLIDGLHSGHGVAVAAAWMADALGAAGHEPLVVGSEAVAASELLGRDPRFECVRMEPLVGSVLQRARRVAEVASDIDKLAADCVVLVTFPYDRLAGCLQAPTICYDHGSVPRRGTALPLRCALAVVAASAVTARRRSVGVVTVSDWLANRMGRWTDRSRIRVVPNGADHMEVLRGTMLPERPDARGKLGLPMQGFVALTIGRMVREARYKGVDKLAIALDRAGYFRCGGVLLSAGDAEEGECARLRAAGVTVLGRLSAHGLGLAFAACDLVVSASTWEGFNLPLLEAQWLGLPVMALRRCAHPEVVYDKRSLVRTIGDLARRLSSLQVNGSDAAVDGADERRAFARRFTWQSAGEQFEAAVEDLLGG